MAHAGIKSYPNLVGLRIALGAFEAGFNPTSFYVLSGIYPKYSAGVRMGIFTGMYAVAGALAGLIAYGLLNAHAGHYHPWQLLFLVEGGITIFVAILIFIFVPNTLESAWWLTKTEKQHAVRRMQIDQEAGQEYDEYGQPIPDSHSITRRDITDVLKDWRKLLLILFNILAILPVSAFTVFLPLIVQGMGYAGIHATIMSVSPFVVGAVVMVLVVFSSDYFRDRSLHLVSAMLVALVGCIVMATSHNNAVRYAFTHICFAGVFIPGPIAAVWLAQNTPKKVNSVKYTSETIS
jgi:MFS family permease